MSFFWRIRVYDDSQQNLLYEIRFRTRTTNEAAKKLARVRQDIEAGTMPIPGSGCFVECRSAG